MGLPESYPALMNRTPFTVRTSCGELSGWVTGAGPRVLAIHGGPGMSFTYLDDAVEELAGGYRVATYQQRGLAPSTDQGEFTILEAVTDIAAVLDGLGWDTAYLMGHSWGGHLVFHAAASIPERLAGVLSVDPLGAVGDGGAEAFGAEMLARVPRPLGTVPAVDVKDTAGERPRRGARVVLVVLGVVLRRSRCRPADAPPRVLPVGQPRAGRGPDGPAART